MLVAAFIGLAFRSVVVMLASILPGIFPVVVSGTVLWLMGEGLQFASVVALTVSFGLGLERDDPLPQPAAAGETSRARMPALGGRARRPCWSARR